MRGLAADRGDRRGDARQARRLASKGGLVVVVLWVLGFVFVSPLALPADEGVDPAKLEKQEVLAPG